jgi:hypothetical protein
MFTSKISLSKKNPLRLQRFVCVRDGPKTVVIALGGNALLRDGQVCTQDVQAENIKIAAKQIAKIAVQRESYNIILTHGNGPQVCIDYFFVVFSGPSMLFSIAGGILGQSARGTVPLGCIDC